MRLPESVQEIADVIGVERALYLIGRLPRCIGGSKKAGKCSSRVIMYVPKTLKPNHPLVQLLGWHDAFKLVKHFGGEILQPANCNEVYRAFRDESIARFAARGLKPSLIAELMGISDRQVRNVLREIPPEDNTAANDNTPAHLFKNRAR